ncbi:mycothiol synthase [Tomitella gaofuii]|uniref:mycothiol synthase n=1 Tax=Tomitella gaofuii TaxID=2760083 RepID=UPI0015FBD3D8|nr:mycothiol synthase [Tomitella gaofuii]
MSGPQDHTGGAAGRGGAGGHQLRRTPQLTQQEADAVRSAVAVTTRVDGVEPIGDGPMRSLAGGDGVLHLLVRDASGRLLAYANIDAPKTPRAMVEAFVVPDARGTGIASALLQAATAEAGSQGRIWAHGDGAAARAVAERMDMDVRRELLQLARPLTDPALPSLRVPDGVTIRRFRDDDEAELLRVNNAAFSWHPEQGGWTGDDFAEHRAQPWFDPDGIFLAFDEARPEALLGFHWTKIHPAHGDAPPLGEVYVLGVDPAAQGRGLGAVLTLVGLEHLRDLGLDTVMLYVEGDNTAAVNTYTRLGFTRSRADVAYGWSS